MIIIVIIIIMMIFTQEAPSLESGFQGGPASNRIGIN